jgi:predicted transcriptional regulator
MAKRGPKGPRPTTEPRRTLSARVPADLADWVDAEAERLALTRSELIETALRDRQARGIHTDHTED